MFAFWHFPPIFDPLKLTCLVTLFDRKLQVFKNSPNWTLFDIFNELLSLAMLNENFSLIFNQVVTCKRGNCLEKLEETPGKNSPKERSCSPSSVARKVPLTILKIESLSIEKRSLKRCPLKI